MMKFPFTPNGGNLAHPTSLVPDDGQFLTNSVSHVAYVTNDVLPGKGGRLHYLSTEWAARSIDNSFIPEGTLVRPVMRQGNTWLVAVDQQAPRQQAA